MLTSVAVGGLLSTAWSRSDYLSLSQLVFTVLGFGAAIWQLRRTASASEDTRDAVAGLQVRLTSNDLLVALPQLQTHEDEIETAIKGNDTAKLERHLVIYLRTASEIHSMLEGHEDLNDEPLSKSLAAASKAAQRLKSDLAKGAPIDLPSFASVATAKIMQASVDASGLKAKLQRKVST